MSASQSKFIPEIQALRGIAAMCVVAEHSFVPMTPFRVGMFGNPADYQEVMQWITHTVFNGRSAVILFFVLSGYVLKNQWDSQTTSTGLQKYAAYLVRRAFRILPALWLSVLFGYACAVYFALPVAHEFHNFVNGLLLRDLSLNLPLWTIAVEFYCSLIFPIVLWLHARSGKLGHIAIASCLLAYFSFGDIMAMRFLMFFYCGLLIHDYGQKFVHSLGAWQGYTLATSIVVYCLLPQLWVFENRIFTMSDDTYYLALLAPACFSILAIIVYGNVRPVHIVLNTRAAIFLGEISYSLYLFHYVISRVFWQMLINQVSDFWPYYYFVEFAFFLCIAALATGLAAMVYFVVEKPMSDIGRALGKRIERYNYSPCTARERALRGR